MLMDNYCGINAILLVLIWYKSHKLGQDSSQMLQQLYARQNFIIILWLASSFTKKIRSAQIFEINDNYLSSRTNFPLTTRWANPIQNFSTQNSNINILIEKVWTDMKY